MVESAWAGKALARLRCPYAGNASPRAHFSDLGACLVNLIFYGQECLEQLGGTMRNESDRNSEGKKARLSGVKDPGERGLPDIGIAVISLMATKLKEGRSLSIR